VPTHTKVHRVNYKSILPADKRVRMPELRSWLEDNLPRLCRMAHEEPQES